MNLENVGMQDSRAQLKAEREAIAAQLAAGGDILAQRQYAEKQYEASRAQSEERGAILAQFAHVLEGANAPDEASRTSCAESITAFLNGVPAALVDVEGVARALHTLLEREPSQAVRAAAGRAFGVLERHFEQRAEQLFSSLSDGVQAELVAALSARALARRRAAASVAPRRRAAPPRPAEQRGEQRRHVRLWPVPRAVRAEIGSPEHRRDAGSPELRQPRAVTSCVARTIGENSRRRHSKIEILSNKSTLFPRAGPRCT